MTDRGLPLSDGATACPFVAFDDDRDERSDRPDHRHRCYAEIPPAPRAIAHQEAYCLTNAFAVCPTFQDWAQREAARTRRVAQAKADAAAAAAAAGGSDPAAAEAAAASGTPPARRPLDDDASPVQPADEWRGRRPVEEDDGPLLPPRRNPPRDWAAPPPWAAGAAGGAGVGSVGGARSGRGSDPDAPQFLADRAEGRGLAGSAADRLAAGEPVGPVPSEAGQRPPPPRQARPVRAVHGPDRTRHDEDAEELASLVRPRQREREPEPDDDDTSRFRTDRPGRSRGVPPGGNSGGRRSAAPRASDDAPSWEEPRRYEAYPTIKTRSAMPGLPRLGIMVAALALAALVLFVGPGLFGLFGDDDNGGGALDASPSPTIAAESSSPEPTVAPAPTQQVYVIKSGDTLSKVATRFNVTLDELLDANKDTIKNPDRIAVGDEIIIPPPSELEE